MDTPSVNRIDSMCWKGTDVRPMNRAAATPAVNADIQPIAARGTTTRPRPATPRPAMIDAAITCAPGSIDGKR